MPGPTTLGLMALPIVLAAVAAVFLVRLGLPGTGVIKGAPLILVALPVAVLAQQLRPRVDDPALVNRVEAIALVLLAVTFAFVNRRSGRLTRGAALLLAAGIWLNSTAVLVYGYMPVLSSAAAAADNPFSGTHPSPGYVSSGPLGPVGMLIGDFIPLPHLLKVLSLGDLALFSASALLLSSYLARMWIGPEPSPSRCESDPIAERR